ncbi:ribonuclease P protein component [bacterium]|nr:ribonuclease P protein component [bacterium]
MLQPLTKNSSYPRKFRIRKRKEFLFVQKGNSFFHDAMVLMTAPNLENYPKLGVVVSKKIGNAVVRNYYKRVFRTLFRINRALFSNGKSYVFSAKRGILNHTFQEIEEIFYSLVIKSND